MPAEPKPQKSTPESRRHRRELVRQIKQEFRPELFRERIRDREQTPVVTADPGEVNEFRTTGSSLRTISRKRLEAHKGKRLTSTFSPKPGRRLLQHKRKIGQQTVRRVVAHGWTFKRGQALRVEGVRGRRLRPADRKEEAATHILSCLCGCNTHLRPGVDGIPGKGLISRAHLIGRGAESVRNDPRNNVPACDLFHDWLDQQAKGKQEEETAKRAFWNKAVELGRRLTHEDAYGIINEFGYYTWLHDRRIP